MTQYKYTTPDNINHYEDSVTAAVEIRTDNSVKRIRASGRDMTLVMEMEPNKSTLTEIDDIMAVTERERKSVNNNKVTYHLPKPSGEKHLYLEERVSETASIDGELGESRGSLMKSDISADKQGENIFVGLPDDATVERLDKVMLALGKVRIE